MADRRVTYDPSADAAYVYFRPIEPGGSRVQCPVECPEAAAIVVLDLDREGRLIGVEIVGARQGLPAELLTAAELL